mgnify:FL=1|jgi:hypothetical protein
MSIEEQIEHDGDEYWFTETITLIAEQDPVTKEWIYFDDLDDQDPEVGVSQ